MASDRVVTYAVPIRVRDEVTATLIAIGEERGNLCPVDEKGAISMEMLAELAAAALTNASLYSHLAETLDELAHARSSLLAAQRLEAVGQLAAGVAHEINTPIQYVADNLAFLRDSSTEMLELIGALRAVSRQEPPPEGLVRSFIELIETADLDFLADEVPDAVAQALDGVGRVASIVRALKAFSHPGDETKTPTDVNRIIETTATVARNEWRYVADLHLDLYDDVGFVDALPGPLGQVILNLLVNAAHAIADRQSNEEKGQIVIRSYRLSDRVCIEVSDTGGGIPEQLWHRIFDPFFTTKDVGRGTGQGLAIAREVVVTQHDGDLTFEVDPGVGTTFLIELPLGSIQSEDAA